MFFIEKMKISEKKIIFFRHEINTFPYFIYEESKNKFIAKKNFRQSRGVAGGAVREICIDDISAVLSATA